MGQEMVGRITFKEISLPSQFLTKVTFEVKILCGSSVLLVVGVFKRESIQDLLRVGVIKK